MRMHQVVDRNDWKVICQGEISTKIDIESKKLRPILKEKERERKRAIAIFFFPSLSQNLCVLPMFVVSLTGGTG